MVNCKIVRINKSKFFKGIGSVDDPNLIKTINEDLGNFLKLSGAKKPFAALPEIDTLKISNITLPTTNTTSTTRMASKKNKIDTKHSKEVRTTKTSK
jgi:hypothetical protein